MDRESYDRHLLDVEEITDVELGEAPVGMVVVQDYLTRFGYLAEEDFEEGIYDESSAMALSTFQHLFGLPQTGILDAETLALMQQPRCGMPDARISLFARFALTCCWESRELTFAFDNGTDQIGGGQEFNAIRAAFRTWDAVGLVNFTEVGVGDSPTVLIGWRVANDPDYTMVGTTLAHADFPTGCSVVTNNLPKPIHFDETEATWVIGAVPGAFDVESVALHEIGHIVGLAHSTDANSVMFPFINANSTKRALTSDDLQGFRKLYPIVPHVREMRPATAAERVRAVGLVPKFNGPTGSNAWVWRQSPLGGRAARCNSTVSMQTREGPIP